MFGSAPDNYQFQPTAVIRDFTLKVGIAIFQRDWLLRFIFSNMRREAQLRHVLGFPK